MSPRLATMNRVDQDSNDTSGIAQFDSLTPRLVRNSSLVAPDAAAATNPGREDDLQKLAKIERSITRGRST